MYINYISNWFIHLFVEFSFIKRTTFVLHLVALFFTVF